MEEEHRIKEYWFRRKRVIEALQYLHDQLLRRHSLFVQDMECLRRVCVALDIRPNDPFDRVEFKHLTQWLREEYEPLNSASMVAADLCVLAHQIERNVYRNRLLRLNFFLV